MFPLMASSISASVGLGFFASSAAADMICPDWQYPHCGTSSSIQAFCTGCDASVESPSIVVIFFPATLETGVMQERDASTAHFELANSCPTAQVANCGVGRLWLETSSFSVLEGACSGCERSRSNSFVCSRATSVELCI